jgi:hypothetical protein
LTKSLGIDSQKRQKRQRRSFGYVIVIVGNIQKRQLGGSRSAEIGVGVIAFFRFEKKLLDDTYFYKNKYKISPFLDIVQQINQFWRPNWR